MVTALVSYSDSDSDSGGEDGLDPSQSKRRRVLLHSANVGSKNTPRDPSLPALPDRFDDHYAVNPRISTSDDSSLHAGRKRKIPHRDGNWPSHVYIEWIPRASDRSTLEKLIENSRQDHGLDVHSSFLSDLGVILPLHISLSAPLILRTETKGAFLQQVKKAISDLHLSAFQLQAHGLQWAANEDQSRWFLVLQLSKAPQDPLSRIVRTLNHIAADFQQPLLYVQDSDVKPDPSRVRLVPDLSSRFHISIGWTLQRPVAKGQCTGNALTSKKDLRSLRDLTVEVHSIKVKIGSDVSRIPFDALS